MESKAPLTLKNAFQNHFLFIIIYCNVINNTTFYMNTILKCSYDGPHLKSSCNYISEWVIQLHTEAVNEWTCCHGFVTANRCPPCCLAVSSMAVSAWPSSCPVGCWREGWTSCAITYSPGSPHTGSYWVHTAPQGIVKYRGYILVTLSIQYVKQSHLNILKSNTNKCK